MTIQQMIPPKLHFHEIQHQTIREIGGPHPMYIPSIAEQYPLPDLKFTTHEAYRATIKVSEITEYEDFRKEYMKEVELRRHPAVRDAYMKYQTILHLIK